MSKISSAMSPFKRMSKDQVVKGSMLFGFVLAQRVGESLLAQDTAR